MNLGTLDKGLQVKKKTAADDLCLYVSGLFGVITTTPIGGNKDASIDYIINK